MVQRQHMQLITAGIPVRVRAGLPEKRMVGARRYARREDLFFVSPGGGTYIYARARAFAELVKREGLEPRREKA